MKDSYENGTELLFSSTCFVRDFDENTMEYSNPALTNFVKKSGLKLFHQNINGILKYVDKIKILLNGQNKIFISLAFRKLIQTTLLQMLSLVYTGILSNARIDKMEYLEAYY